ncbi:MAG: hypothetical protein RSE41_06015 [Clostridia bacterium]
MFKINIHCHTTYSDGREPLAVMMLEHIKQHFSAFVVTDHLKVIQRLSDYKKSLNDINHIEQQRKELNSLSRYLNYSAIQGVELWLKEEEVLLFGIEVIREVCRFINDYEGDNIYVDVIKFISERKTRCAVVLCHPRLSGAFTEKMDEYYMLLHSIIDGYEVFNCGINWVEEHLNTAKQQWLQFTHGKEFCNSDAHCLENIVHGNNSHERPIRCEEELIKWIKGEMR